MKKKYILLLLLGFFGMNISAQTLTQAKALYEKGQYDQAKPAFKKFVKSQPNNGSYNLWYGVCCLNTGEAEEAIKYLETAVKRRAAGGQLYLAQAYNATYRFEDAVNTFEEYIAELTKRRRPTAEAEDTGSKAKICITECLSGRNPGSMVTSQLSYRHSSEATTLPGSHHPD